jgi:hypothetical protein
MTDQPPSQKNVSVRLISHWGYSPAGAQSVWATLAEANAEIARAFRDWRSEGVLDDRLEVQSYTLRRLTNELQILQPGAFATLVWLCAEPVRALETLQRGHDRVLVVMPAEVSGAQRPDAAGSEAACYETGTNRTTLRADWVANTPAREVMEMILHTGRHAYQYFAVSHPEKHSNREEVHAWGANFARYLRFEENPWAYANQPIEVDAGRYAQAIANRLYGRSQASVSRSRS